VLTEKKLRRKTILSVATARTVLLTTSKAYLGDVERAREKVWWHVAHKRYAVRLRYERKFNTCTSPSNVQSTAVEDWICALTNQLWWRRFQTAIRWVWKFKL